MKIMQYHHAWFTNVRNHKTEVLPHSSLTLSPTAPPIQTPPTTDRLLSQYQELAYNRSKACGPCTYILSHSLLGLAHRMTQMQLLLLLLYSARLSQGAAYASSKVPTPAMACHPSKTKAESPVWNGLLLSLSRNTTKLLKKKKQYSEVWYYSMKWGCCRTVPASPAWGDSSRVRGAGSRASPDPAGEQGPPATFARHLLFTHQDGLSAIFRQLIGSIHVSFSSFMHTRLGLFSH